MMYRFDMKARTRQGAQGAGDLVRYLQREGEFAPKYVEERDRDVDYMTRVRPDTLAHDDLVGEPLVGNLPTWAQGDAGTYFVAASHYERANGQYAIALQIALPRELTHAQHMALAEDFVEAVMHDKPYLLVKHEPVHEGQAQPHLHILMSPRQVDGIERAEFHHFRRYNPDHPERGGAPKDRFWNQRQAPQKVREAFSDLANRQLELTGAEERIDPRSLRKRGIERERISWKNQVALDPATKAHEQTQAVASWEARKAHKGIDDIHAIPREEFVLLVRQWTREYALGKQLEPSPPEVVQAWLARERERLQAAEITLEGEISQLTRETHRLHAQIMMEEHRSQSPQRSRTVQVGREVSSPQGRTRSPVREIVGLGLEDEERGGLQGPDLEKKRGRDGYDW